VLVESAPNVCRLLTRVVVFRATFQTKTALQRAFGPAPAATS